jgi:uncharacterized protein YbjT (DUF2867 family)
MIAVIGATGFTGHRIVRALQHTHPDERIVAVVRASSSRVRLAGTDVEYRVADLSDRDALPRALDEAAQIVCAASLGFGHASNLCRAILTEGRRHAVFFSTTSIHTQVPNATRETRIRAEAIVRESGIPATILRPTMIYGGRGDRNIERLLGFLHRLPLMPVAGRGQALQQPVFVDDLADAVVRVLKSPAETIGSHYNVPGAQSLSFADLVRIAGEAIGRHVTLLPLPARAVALAASAWQHTGLPPRISEEQVLRMTEDKVFLWDHARADFGYTPRGFREGVTTEAEALGLRNRSPRDTDDRVSSRSDHREW